MERKRTHSGRAFSLPGGLGLGAAVSLTITICGSMFAAKLVDAGTMPEDNIGYSVMIILLLSAFAGAKTAYRKIKRRKMMVCLLSGVLYIGILLGITALFFGGQYDGIGVTSAVAGAGSICAGLLGVPAKSAGKGRRFQTVHR